MTMTENCLKALVISIESLCFIILALVQHAVNSIAPTAPADS